MLEATSNHELADQFDGDVIGVLTYASSAGYQLVTNKATLPSVIKSNLKQEATHIVPAKIN